MAEAVGPIQAELRREAEARRRFVEAQQRRSSSASSAAAAAAAAAVSASPKKKLAPRSLSRRRSSEGGLSATGRGQDDASTPRQRGAAGTPVPGQSSSFVATSVSPATTVPSSSRVYDGCSPRSSAASLISLARAGTAKEFEWAEFHQRGSAFLESRAQKQHAMEKRMEQKEAEECTFEPHLYRTRDAASLRSRSIGSVHTRSAEMEARKAERLKQLRQELLDEEMAQCSFHPRTAAAAAADAAAGGSAVPLRRMSAPLPQQVSSASGMAKGYASRLEHARAWAVHTPVQRVASTPRASAAIAKQDFTNAASGGGKGGYASSGVGGAPAPGDAAGGAPGQAVPCSSRAAAPAAAERIPIARQLPAVPQASAAPSAADASSTADVPSTSAASAPPPADPSKDDRNQARRGMDAPENLASAVSAALEQMEDYLLSSSVAGDFGQTVSTSIRSGPPSASDDAVRHSVPSAVWSPRSPMWSPVSVLSTTSPASAIELQLAAARRPYPASARASASPPGAAARKKAAQQAAVHEVAACIAEGFVPDVSPDEPAPATPRRGSKQASPRPVARRTAVGLLTSTVLTPRRLPGTPPRAPGSQR